MYLEPVRKDLFGQALSKYIRSIEIAAEDGDPVALRKREFDQAYAQYKEVCGMVDKGHLDASHQKSALEHALRPIQTRNSKEFISERTRLGSLRVSRHYESSLQARWSEGPSEIAVGMTGTAYHSGNRVKIRIVNILENGARFVGKISRIDSDDETSGNLIIGDMVAVPREKFCHINQDTFLAGLLNDGEVLYG